MKNPYNYVGFAAIELNIGDKKVADANVKLAKKYGKKDATLLVEIARMYHEADAVAYAEDVKNAMKEALKVDPKSEAYFIFIGDTIAKTASTYNEIVRAVENYDNAIYCNPNSVIPYVKYSGLYKNINLEFSIKKMRECLELNPNSAVAQCELADCLYDAGKWTEACKAYEKYIENPSHFVQDEERYALLLMSCEKYEEAFKVAKGVVGRTESPNLIYRVMMHCKSALGDYFEAAKWAGELMKSKGVAKIIDIDHVTYGDILCALAKEDVDNADEYYAKAIEQYNNAIELNDKCESAYKAIANAYRAIGDYEKAIVVFDNYIELGFAKASDYHIYAGVLLNYANDLSKIDEVASDVIYDKAVDMATESVRRSNSPYAQERKALILYSKNNGKITEEVVRAFEMVVKLLDENNSSDADSYTMALSVIGDYYSNEGDNVKALAAYRRYVEFNPNNAKVNDKIASLLEE